MLASPLIWFALGVGLAVASACLFAFLNLALAELSRSRGKRFQYPFVVPGSRSNLWSWIAGCWRALMIVSAAASFVSFCEGVWTAKQAFERLPTISAQQAATDQVMASHRR